MNATPTAPMTLRADTAGDLMNPNPVSLSEHATVEQAVALLTTKGYHAAPVINEAGHPVGVLSGTDLLIHLRQRHADPDLTEARDMMTPAVFSVGSETPAERVVSDMIALGVHQLFVVDDTGVLVGVITALDLARKLAK